MKWKVYYTLYILRKKLFIHLFILPLLFINFFGSESLLVSRMSKPKQNNSVKRIKFLTIFISFSSVNNSELFSLT